MDVIQQAEQWLATSRDGRISPDDAATLFAEGGAGAAMLALIALAARSARPEISGFKVGAVGEGTSGALYLGANLEFEKAALGETVHAEQAVVANAAAHGETGLVRLAVSAPPCGYCRQFLYELVTADRLEILLRDKQPAALTDFLPGAFGPADLGVSGGMLSPAANGSGGAARSGADPLEAAAVKAAKASYAPYSKARGGAAIRVADGRIFAGQYLENAAFNPSLSPLQAAYVMLVLGGCSASDIEKVSIAQPGKSRIDHCRSGRALLAEIAPRANVRRILLPDG